MENKTKKVRIIELRKNGLTINQIVKELNCSKSTVSYHINKHGMGGQIKKDSTNILFGININVIENVVELRKKGLTFNEIQNQINISKDKISKICKKYNLKNVIRNRYLFIDDDIKNKIKESYKNTKSIRKTAIELKLNRETVRKNITINNEKINTINKKKKNVAYVNTSRRKRKIELLEYKGGKCIVCGYNKSNYALQFHHLDKDKKDFTIGSRNYSLEIMKKEADKCILVCANCHFEIHEEINNNGISSIINNILLNN
jgi:DNA-binding CsgD family transcriptional regulator